jgi:aspartyl-tRNA(Asn)/glutamyl-tRNA(Gln) amidotransferase subunit A
VLTLLEAADQIRARKLSPVELTHGCLARIEELNPTLNAFITVTADLALDQSRKAEAEIAAGNYRGPLHGIPFALKDNIDTAGVRTTAGSNQFRERVPTEDAEIVRQLKLAGGVIVGKTNMHEFAYGGSGVISAFGPACNPCDPERITGGSSSGSAAAVAAGMCIAAIGTDTAGSIRCPAALCGIVGHRASQGMLSNAGIIPLAKSFDTPGPMAQTVADAVAVLQALTPMGWPSLFSERTNAADLIRLRVGVARNLAGDLDSEVAHIFEAAVEAIRPMVSSVRDLEVKMDIPWELRNFEIYRYHEQMMRTSPGLYQPATLERLRSMAVITEPDYVQRCERFKVELRSNALFSEIDIVLSPTVPVTAPLLSDLEAITSTALREYELKYLLRNTAPFSFLWWPSVSVPCGFTNAGLPVGLQISTAPGADLRALRLAQSYERGAK